MAAIDVFGPLPARTNYSLDPNMTRSAYWNASSSLTMTAETARFYTLSTALRGTVNAAIAAGGQLLGTPVYNGTAPNTAVPVVAGEDFDAMLAVSTDVAGVSMRIRLQFYTGAGALVGSAIDGPATAIATDGSYTLVAIRGVSVPATAVFVLVLLLTVNALSIGNILYFGASDFARIDEFDTFVTGAYGGRYKWDGVANQSTSTRAAGVPQGIVGVGGQITVDCRVWASDLKGNLYDELSDYVTGGSIANDIDRDIKGTLTLNVTDPNRFSAFTWVRVFQYITREVEGTTEAFTVGLFRLEQPSAEWFEGIGTVAGLDPTVMLYQTTTSKTYNIASGITYVAAIRAILDALGFVGRHSIPNDSRTIPAGGLTFPSGTTYAAIVNKLLDAIGYYTIYAMPDGTLSSMPYLDRMRTEPTHVFTLGQDAELVGSIREETNDDNLYNHVVVTKTAANQSVLSASAENAEPSHPYSTVSLGLLANVPKVYRSKVVTINDAADNTSLSARAREELEQASMMRYATVSVLPHPEHVPHEIAELVFDDTDAEHLSGRWYIDSSAFGLVGADSVMTLKMRRVESYGQ